MNFRDVPVGPLVCLLVVLVGSTAVFGVAIAASTRAKRPPRRRPGRGHMVQAGDGSWMCLPLAADSASGLLGAGSSCSGSSCASSDSANCSGSCSSGSGCSSSSCSSSSCGGGSSCGGSN